MPNGEFLGVIPVPPELDVPGVPSEATSFGSLIETTVDFFTGLFGGGGHDPVENILSLGGKEAPRVQEAIQDLTEGKELDFTSTTIIQSLFSSGLLAPGEIQARRTFQGLDPQTGFPTPAPVTTPIPTPEQGGPPLVTERFRNLPPIPDVPEFTQGTTGFEGISDMPVDVPLLASLLPAVRGVVQPSIQGVVGGLAGGFLSEFLRPIQETGLGTVPMRQAVPQVATGCPQEKPHTRILRFIKQNTGVSMKLTRVKSLIRELGLENAARCLGVNVSEACSLLIVASPRRRRGISASDIRIVRRTARRFENLKHDLGHLGGRPGHHFPRRRRTRHAHK